MTTPDTDRAGIVERLPILCRLHLHKWRFTSPDMAGSGCFEQCKRCGIRRWFSFLGYYVYEK